MVYTQVTVAMDRWNKLDLGEHTPSYSASVAGFQLMPGFEEAEMRWQESRGDCLTPATGS